jgi:deoxyribodipyrimidine photo-lyase
LRYLRDADVASNQHGWQWVAGCGTDAAPFHRIFNPTRQGLTFDPNGDFVRRWVPELRSVAGPAVHEPWTMRGTLNETLLTDYPQQIIDHSEQRQEALRRFAVLPPRSA